jgi:methyltransferase
MSTLPSFLALLLLVGGARLFELSISRRRQRALRTAGIKPAPEPHFRAMVLLHTGILIGAGLEAWWLQRSTLGIVSAVALVVVLAANALRIWVIATLGPHWNVQIMDSLPLGVVASGPFRFIRHPNYVAVFLELAALPLVGGAWMTALIGSAAHLWVLSHRIRAEEAVLLAHPEYRAVMGNKPRFIPKLRSRPAPAATATPAAPAIGPRA